MPVTTYKRDVIEGIPFVASALSVRDDGKPGFTFSPSCPVTYAECKQYQWKPTKEGTEQKREQPLKVNDDGPDMLRALLHGRQQSKGEAFGISVWGNEPQDVFGINRLLRD